MWGESHPDSFCRSVVNHPDNVCFGAPYLIDVDVYDSPFSTSFTILYFSIIDVFDFSFTTSNLRCFSLQNKTAKF